jgi:hypothetical protein
MSILKELLEAIDKLGINWQGTRIESNKWYMFNYGSIRKVFDSQDEGETWYESQGHGDPDDELLFNRVARLDVIGTKEDAEDFVSDEAYINLAFDVEDYLLIKGSILKAWIHRFPVLRKPSTYWENDLISSLEDKLNDTFDLSSLIDDEDDEIAKRVRDRKFIDFKNVHGVNKAVITRKSSGDAQEAFKKIRSCLVSAAMDLKQVGEPNSFGVSRWIGKFNTPSGKYSSVREDVYVVLEHFNTQVHITIYPQRLLPNAIQRLLTKRK